MRSLASAAAAFSLAFTAAPDAGAQTLIRDTEIEVMLRDFTDPLLQAAGLRPEEVGMYIVGENTINAFVTRGQNIFVNTGTILEADTPNMLKGVLAHETGHISGAHLARMGDGVRGAYATMALTMGLGILAALAGEGGAAGALMASSGQFGTLAFATYTRTQESAADQAGLQFLEATGQSGEGLVRFFERFRYQEVMSEARRYPYFRSHPLSGDRIGALQRRVEASPYRHVQDSEEDIDRLRRAQAKIYGFLATPEQVFFRYPESDQSLYGRYARTVAYYRTGRLQNARSEIESLLEDEPENPYFHELYGQLLFESGRAGEAIPHHQRTVELAPDAPLFRINLAMAMIATEDRAFLDDARRHLTAALAQEQDNSFAWYQLSLVHERMGETALAQFAIAEQAYALGDNMRAFQFASRAREGLDHGSPAWIRAAEIMAITQPTAAELRRTQREQQRRYLDSAPAGR